MRSKLMELVHVKLHPTLISAYNLRLSMPGMSMLGKGASMNMNTSSVKGTSGVSMPGEGSSSTNMNKHMCCC